MRTLKNIYWRFTLKRYNEGVDRGYERGYLHGYEKGRQIAYENAILALEKNTLKDFTNEALVLGYNHATEIVRETNAS